jgi:two-component system NtrC family response regulator/two-component system response regulator AtoC
MNGMELLKKIKEVDGRASVIMITGHGTIDSALVAMKNGATEYITKPINFGEFEFTVKRVLEKKRLEKRLSSYRWMAAAFGCSIPLWLLSGVLLGVLVLRN